MAFIYETIVFSFRYNCVQFESSVNFISFPIGCWMTLECLIIPIFTGLITLFINRFKYTLEFPLITHSCTLYSFSLHRCFHPSQPKKERTSHSTPSKTPNSIPSSSIYCITIDFKLLRLFFFSKAMAMFILCFTLCFSFFLTSRDELDLRLFI